MEEKKTKKTTGAKSTTTVKKKSTTTSNKTKKSTTTKKTAASKKATTSKPAVKKDTKKATAPKKAVEKTKEEKIVVSEEPKKVEKTKETKKPTSAVKKTKIAKEVKAPAFSSNEVSNLLKIILAVTAVFLVFYGITSLVTKNKKQETTDTEDVTIQYDEILLGALLEQTNSDYFVLVTTEEDMYVDTYNTYISTYKNKENAIRIYTANLDSGFNKNYKSEESNLNISTIKDLKLKTSTLFRISNGQISSYYEGNEQIVSYLKDIIK